MLAPLGARKREKSGGGRTSWQLGLFFCALVTGCSASPPEPIPPSEPTAEQSNEFAATGIDRLIPVRFVLLRDLGEGFPANYITNVNTALTRANFAFKRVGVQFYASSIEAPQTPTLYASPNSLAQLGWAAVYAEFQLIFPQATSTSFSSSLLFNRREWYRLAAEKWADDSQILVYVTVSGGGFGRFPFEARNIEMSRGMLDNSPQLAHEIGHFLGGVHTFDVADSGVLHPETGATLKLADWWDLTYIQDASNNISFPADRAAAQTAQNNGTLYRIENFDRSATPVEDYCEDFGYGVIPPDAYGFGLNCCPTVSKVQYEAGNSSGELRCSVGKGAYGVGYRQVFLTGSAGLAGLSFTTSEANNPPSSRKYGFNAMDYLQGNKDFPSQFSQSQVKMMRAYLRFEVPITDTLFAGQNKSSRRTRLGRSVPRPPAYRLDFDGDGKRDMALWLPPTTTNTTAKFKVFLSSSVPSYSSASAVEIPFGQLGDIPVPGDYNGDGKTDIAVYRPNATGSGGGVSQWHYCLTATTLAGTSCATYPTPISFGTRDSVPVQNTDFLTGPELAVYRPSTGQWQWRTVASSATTTAYLGSSNSTILPGLYDDDTITDLAVYDPTTAQFSLKLSGDSWSSTITRSFPITYVASLSGGTPADRSAALAIPGMYQRRRVISYANGAAVWGNRLALTLWDPQSGNWASMWDPVYDTTTTTCQWGDPSDIPVPSLDLPIHTADSYLAAGLQPLSTHTKLAVFRPASTGNGYLHLRNSTDVCGTWSSPNQGSTPFTLQVFSVSDMDGDQLPEVWQYDTDKQLIYSYSSSGGYTTFTSYNLGGFRGYLL